METGRHIFRDDPMTVTKEGLFLMTSLPLSNQPLNSNSLIPYTCPLSLSRNTNTPLFLRSGLLWTHGFLLCHLIGSIKWCVFIIFIFVFLFAYLKNFFRRTNKSTRRSEYNKTIILKYAMQQENIHRSTQLQFTNYLASKQTRKLLLVQNSFP